MTCPPDHAHGDTLNCYTAHRCRCDSCRTANADYAFWWRHMHAAGRLPESFVDATGTQRRLQALMAIGWSQVALAAHLGIGQTSVSAWMNRTQILASTRDRVATLFAELAMSIPPAETTAQRMSVHRTIALAARRGYAPPLAWDDIDNDAGPAELDDVDQEYVDVVRIEHAVTGHRVELTPAERLEVIRTLNARGFSDAQIAHMASCSSRQVLRIRQAHAIPAIDETSAAA